MEGHDAAVAIADIQKAEVGSPVQAGWRHAVGVVARDAEGWVAAVGRVVAVQPEWLPDGHLAARFRGTACVQRLRPQGQYKQRQEA